MIIFLYRWNSSTDEKRKQREYKSVFDADVICATQQNPCIQFMH